MMRTVGFRFAALLLAVVAGFAAPASALAHGWLHEHASHERHDTHAVTHAAPHAVVAHGVEIEQPDDHHRHGHDTVGAAVPLGERQRLAVSLTVAVVVSRVELTIADEVTTPSVSISNRESPPRPGPGGPSGPRPRAPPAC